ncbi:MAG: hypothetical protein HY775_01875 [Acidobacteria bacterium]|nr:hypothetical protein [Acidobacteriota bacterium]
MAPRPGRFRFSLIALLATALAALASPARAASTDWVLVKITAGPQGAKLAVVALSGTGTGSGAAGPVAFGNGFAGAGFSFVDVGNVGGDGLSLTTTQGAGSQSIRVTPPDGGSIRFRWILIGQDLAPGESYSLLNFLGNATLDFSVDYAASGGSIEVVTSSGQGTTVMKIADPANGGVGVGAGTAAAGTVAVSHTTGQGLVGAVDLWSCRACAWTWNSPDGRSGTALGAAADALVYGAAFGYGDAQFAGPAGQWSWGFTGAALQNALANGSPIIGAWAPIGDDWTLFSG